MFVEASGLIVNDGSYLLNGQGFGPVGNMLQGVVFEPGLRRPYRNPENGQVYCTVNTGKTKVNPDTGKRERVMESRPVSWLRSRGIDNPIYNATTVTKDAYIEFDNIVVREKRKRLRAAADLAARNPRGGFNGMGRLTFEYNAMTDVGEALMDMSGITEGRADLAQFDIKSVPLPIIHSDFWFDARQIAVSRNTGQPVDTTHAEMGTRRVLEFVEKLTIGTEAGLTYGTRSTGPFPHTGSSRIYGYTNFPYRITKTDLNTPDGTNPEAVMDDVSEMVELLEDAGFYGPYILYHSTGYSKWLRGDYFRSGGTSVVRSVRQRLLEIDGLEDIRRLDFLTSGYQLLLVQMDSDVAQMLTGMPVTTVMWEEKGGMLVKFKVMCIMIPLLKSPVSGVAGMVHATTS